MKAINKIEIVERASEMVTNDRLGGCAGIPWWHFVRVNSSYCLGSNERLREQQQDTVVSPGDRLVPGERVRIRAVGERGSARLLDGLTGIVVGPHPFARGWYKIKLDPNEITPHYDWSAPGQELKRINEQEDTWDLPGLTRQQLFP